MTWTTGPFGLMNNANIISSIAVLCENWSFRNSINMLNYAYEIDNFQKIKIKNLTKLSTVIIMFVNVMTMKSKLSKNFS
jgi:hypothetical protein